VVKAVAENTESRKEVIGLLFKQRGHKIKVTEEVVKAVARNIKSRNKVIEFFLK